MFILLGPASHRMKIQRSPNISRVPSAQRACASSRTCGPRDPISAIGNCPRERETDRGREKEAEFSYSGIYSAGIRRLCALLPSRNTLRAKPKPKRSGEATLDAAASALLARFARSRANKSISRERERVRVRGGGGGRREAERFFWTKSHLG